MRSGYLGIETINLWGFFRGVALAGSRSKADLSVCDPKPDNNTCHPKHFRPYACRRQEEAAAGFCPATTPHPCAGCCL